MKLPKYQDLVDFTYSIVKVCIIHNEATHNTWVAPIHPNCGYVPLSEIVAKGGHIVDTGKPVGEIEITAITQSFWTCDCKKNFVHHKIVQHCGKCGQTCGDSKRRLPYLNSIFKWELNVE